MHPITHWASALFGTVRPSHPRPSQKNRPRMETLEDRALLTPGYPTPGGGSPGGGMPTPTPVLTPPSGSPGAPPPVPSSPTGSVPVVFGHGPNHAPHQLPPAAAPPRLILNGAAHSASGVAAKFPRFYELYTGNKLPELNAMSASVKLLPSNTFQFMATNRGMISPTVPALFVFGIDRNGNLPTGPFPNRPNIKFDAVAVVTINPSSAPTAAVIDLAHGGAATTLSSNEFKIQGRHIELSIPASLLPSTGLPPSQFRFNYWPEAFPGFSSNLVASFLPEFSTAQVGVVRGRR
jgi:hypothetical protein